ncbi:glycosyltransferase [Lentibacter algarum]|uniref:glycosyltransferase family 4 protein n=1 Tax=Lentibacter algarum TaxID=576131 RepID=UPI001C069F87|nr:glycosyltransferase [Lentibacter algarum]MBU2980653.1 glycosyltransferase [Lentibacter algarum]
MPRELWRRIEAAKRCAKPALYPREYGRIKPYFDVEYYLTRYPDIALAWIDPIAHYIRAGAAEGRCPHPSFTAQADQAQPQDARVTAFGKWVQQGCPDLPLVATQEQCPLTPIEGTAWARAERLFDATDVPHYGARLHKHVLAAWMNESPPGFEEEYYLIKPHFDIAYYLSRSPDLIEKNLDPVAHFLRAGADEARDPQAGFSERGFARRYPDLVQQGQSAFAAWIRAGQGEDLITSAYDDIAELAAAMKLVPITAQKLHRETQADVGQRLAFGELGKQVKAAAELDPLIAQSWPEALDLRVAPFNSALTVSRTIDMMRLQERAHRKRAKAVVLVNRPRWGSGRRMEGYIAHALAEIYGAHEVVVMTTEVGGDTPKGRMPEGIRLVDMSDIRSAAPEKQRLLFEFLRSLRPEVVFNINSRTCWDMLKPYGKALCRETRVVGGLFCAEQSVTGFWTGYPVHRFYRHLGKLHAVCTDSHALVSELSERYQLPPESAAKLHVLSAPVDASIPIAEAPAAANPRKKVFWSGRFDPQKRVDIAYKIAEAMPDVDFHMWGEKFLKAGHQGLAPAPDNVTFEGKYASFDALPIETADLWLYTSEWDGVPSILLEVAMTGLPIVGAHVGGTGEVLKAGLSQPIAPFDDVAAFVAAIRQTLAEPQAARNQAAKLRDALIAERTEAAYLQAVKVIVSAPNGSDDAESEREA